MEFRQVNGGEAGELWGEVGRDGRENFVEENGICGGECRAGKTGTRLGEFGGGGRISRWGVSRWNFVRGKFAFPQGRGK